MIAAPRTREVTLSYAPRGSARAIFSMQEPEIILAGPAGTGKSRAWLEKLHLACLLHPNLRASMVRKTRRSLTESGMVTYWQKVLPQYDGVQWKASDQHYQYRNGSILAVGGLDKPSKIMSSEWDIILFQEATEGTEEDWESLSTRLRNGKNSYAQLVGDVNPGPPTHWIKQRANAGKTIMLESRHEDNPLLFDDNGMMTPEGERYIGILDALTGVRYLRLRLGLWAAAEGMVYEDSWDRNRILVNTASIPPEWPRYLAIDFGFTHPFVCLWAAVDPDGRLIVYRQLYHTKRLVEDHAKEIKRVSRWGEKGGDPLPRAIIVDHDAEDYRTLERHLGMYTMLAQKNVSAGIQAVASRFKAAGDGKPRIVIQRDSLVERDRDLTDRKLPTCLEDEPESYIWDVRQGMKRGEAPVKENDHGLDALRYLVAYFDLIPSTVKYSQRIY
jgi:PBSX family phage terminase large subunit